MWTLVLFSNAFIPLVSIRCLAYHFPKAGTASFRGFLSLLGEALWRPRCLSSAEEEGVTTGNFISIRWVFVPFEDLWKTMREGELNQFLSSPSSDGSTSQLFRDWHPKQMSHFGAECLDKGSLSRLVRHSVTRQQLIISVCHNLCLCVTEERKTNGSRRGFLWLSW